MSLQLTFRERLIFVMPPDLLQDISETSLSHGLLNLRNDQRRNQDSQRSVSDEEQPLVKSENDEPTLTDRQVLVNIMSIYVGAGVLGIPKDMIENGWLTSSIVLVLSAMVTALGAQVLGQATTDAHRLAQGTGQSIRSLEDVAGFCFGPWGRTAFNVYSKFTLVIVIVFYSTFFAQMSKIFTALAYYNWLNIESGIGRLMAQPNVWYFIFFLAPVLPMIWQRTVSFIAKLGLLGLIVTIGMCVLPYCAVFWELATPSNDYIPVPKFGKITQLPALMSTFALAFGWNFLNPGEVLRMQNPHRFGRQINIAHGFGVAFYGALGLSFIYAFGEKGKVFPTDIIYDMSTTSTPMFLILLILVFCLVLKGIFSSTFVGIFVADNIVSYLNPRASHVYRFSFRAILVGSCFLWAAYMAGSEPLSVKNTQDNNGPTFFFQLLDFLGTYGLFPIQVWLPYVFLFALVRKYPDDIQVSQVQQILFYTIFGSGCLFTCYRFGSDMGLGLFFVL